MIITFSRKEECVYFICIRKHTSGSSLRQGGLFATTLFLPFHLIIVNNERCNFRWILKLGIWRSTTSFCYSNTRASMPSRATWWTKWTRSTITTRGLRVYLGYAIPKKGHQQVRIAFNKHFNNKISVWFNKNCEQLVLSWKNSNLQINNYFIYYYFIYYLQATRIILKKFQFADQ